MAALNPPRQARSRDTLERIAATAVRLLNAKPWAQISVSELATSADASVGAFYTRFADKDALLDYLDERYAESLIALLRRDMAAAKGHRTDLEQRAARLLRSLVRLCRRYRGLLATVVLEARGAGSERFAERTRRMNDELPALARSFAATAGVATSPADVRTALAFTFSALRDQVLYPGSVPAFERRVRDRELVAALVRNFVGYLRVAEPPG